MRPEQPETAQPLGFRDVDRRLATRRRQPGGGNWTQLGRNHQDPLRQPVRLRSSAAFTAKRTRCELAVPFASEDEVFLGEADGLLDLGPRDVES